MPSTGITDYRAIAEKLGELVEKEGGEIHLGRAVRSVVRRRADVVVRTDGGDLLGPRSSSAPGCAATSWPRASGADPGVRIIPFRGEYSGFAERAAGLVKGLIYPVPDPAFPFLGVHATRGIDGSVHAGPNAVLALAREGYSWGVVKPKELLGSLAYPGMLRLARQHWRYGLGEMHRSLSREAMVRQIQRLLPDVRADDLHPAGAGVRAQAVRPDGSSGRRLPVRRARDGCRRGAARAQRAVAGRDRGAADRAGDPRDADRRETGSPLMFRRRPRRLPLRLRLLRRPPERRQVDADERADRAEGRDHLQPAADHPPRDPRHPAPARRAADRDRHSGPAQAAHAARQPAQRLVRETWAEVDVIGFCVPADQPVGRGDEFIVSELRPWPVARRFSASSRRPTSPGRSRSPSGSRS